MNKRIVLQPTDRLIEIVADQLIAEGNDFSKRAAVFPGKRPAHFLRKELARRIRASFIPPRIFSIDEFVVSLYQQMNTTAERDIEPIDAVVLLFDIHCKLQERLGGEYFRSFESFIPIGFKLFGELEELCLAALTDRKIREVLSPLSYNRLFSLGEYYVQFYDQVRHEGLVTRAIRYTEVAKKIFEINLSEYTHIVIAGLFQQTHAEKIIFDELANRANTICIYQSDKPDSSASEPEIFFYKASDTHGQVFSLSALVKNHLESKKKLDEHSVIVLPTAEALFPVVHQTLSLLPEEQYNIALGYPMERTPVYGFLSSLLECVSAKQGDRYSTSTYLKFVLHPYTKNVRLGNRTDITRILFHGLELNFAKDKSKTYLTLDEIEGSDEVFTHAAAVASESGEEITAEQLKEHLRKIHACTIRLFDHIDSLKDFAHKAIDVLTFMYERSTAQLHPLFRPYAEAFLEMFLKLEQSYAGKMAFQDSTGYNIFLRQYIAGQEVPFPGTPLRGLQILGLLETRNLQFDDVYMIDVNDEILPGSIGTDMLLPQQLRERLGLETRHDRDKLMEHYFNQLIRGAQRVHLFFSESGEKTKSRFVEQLLWERQKKDKTYSAEKYVQTINYQVKLANDAVAPIVKSQEARAILNGFIFSASAMDTYIQCPIKFYYRHILKLEEKEEASENIDNQDIGEFVHKVLNKFYAPYVGKKLELLESDIARMEQLVEEMFAQAFGQEPSGGAFLLKRQLVRRLKDLLTEYQTPMTEAAAIILQSLEENIALRAFGVQLQGRIDRIEQRGDAFVIIDYKTGSRPSAPPINFKKLDIDDRASWSESIHSLQLPMYMLLYSQKTGKSIKDILPVNLYIGDGRINKESEVPFLEDVSERTACFTYIENLVSALVRDIQNAEIPFSPPADLRNACPSCPYTALCGTAWVQGWKS